MKLPSITVLPAPKTETTTVTSPPRSNQVASTTVRGDDFVGRPGRNGPVPTEPGEPTTDPWSGKEDAALKSALKSYVTDGKASVSYSRARDIMYGDVDNHDGKVKCVYTDREITASRPPNSNDMNVEHTWPQSKGATGTAKSDMHHLFPTDSRANSIRGNHPFGIVTNVKESWPSGARFGTDASGRTVFEPPPDHKGNVARALFYFSTTYSKPLTAEEESVLREWNVSDPVDTAEIERNDRVQGYQKTRNPFIDHPQLAARIDDF